MPLQAVRGKAGIRGWDAAPKLGPLVAMVSVTAVVPVPAAIVAGLNAQLVSAGRFEHAKLTVELNDPPPAGNAENV